MYNPKLLLFQHCIFIVAKKRAANHFVKDITKMKLFKLINKNLQKYMKYAMRKILKQKTIREIVRNWISDVGKEFGDSVTTFIASFKAGSTVARSARASSSSFLHSFCSSAIRCDLAVTCLCVSSASRRWFAARRKQLKAIHGASMNTI